MLLGRLLLGLDESVGLAVGLLKDDEIVEVLGRLLLESALGETTELRTELLGDGDIAELADEDALAALAAEETLDENALAAAETLAENALAAEEALAIEELAATEELLAAALFEMTLVVVVLLVGRPLGDIGPEEMLDDVLLVKALLEAALLVDDILVDVPSDDVTPKYAEPVEVLIAAVLVPVALLDEKSIVELLLRTALLKLGLFSETILEMALLEDIRLVDMLTAVVVFIGNPLFKDAPLFDELLLIETLVIGPTVGAELVGTVLLLS